ncbi:MULTISPECIES: sensor histidine kinase [Aquimarina]|uniref:sensor histidine kinase n=1 Tax=Aquimarina TaxID=290174 RepID=UPI0009423BA7|nr:MULTISPECIES: histidine kinase [Aquimarina]
MNILLQLINLGITENSTPLEIKRSKVLNVSVLIILFNALFFLCVDTITQDLTFYRFIVVITQVLIYCGILYLQKMRKLLLSRGVFITAIMALIFFNANYAFRGFYGEYQYVIIPMLSLLFFDKKYINYTVLTLSIIVFYLPNYFYHNYPEKYFGYLNYAFIFIGVFLIVNLFKNLNIKNELALKENNNKLQKQNSIIETQKLLLEKAYSELEVSKKNELAFLQLKSLKSQMNPHFIFNSLNSIQDLILQQNTDASYDYIVLFAQLVRNTLNYSNKDFIAIDKELEFLEIYLQLEKLRFEDDFTYTIEHTNTEGLSVPSLIVQPFIENALIHGLLHKAGKKQLTIDFTFADDLLCTVTDNGIGRKEAKKIQARQGGHHESFALEAIQQRLEILKEQYGTGVGYQIFDLYDNGYATGTKVEIRMPFQKKY